MNRETKSASAKAVVIGASVGAIGALNHILPGLPADYPLPVLVVVHIPPDRKALLVELYASRCHMSVKEAEDKEAIRAGTIYFAPPNYHLLVEEDFTLALSSDEPVLYSRPAVDVLFESAADAYGDDLVGIVLTGASADGARGLRTVHAAGGLAIVQTPESSEGTVMPRSAIARTPDARVMELEEIARFLVTDLLNPS